MLQASEPQARTTTFGGRPIGHDERVLTPRPWTEAQSLWARELLDAVPLGPVLEVCAGAGHIGLLAVADTGRHLVQVDADLHACVWASRNARVWGVDSDIRHGAMAEALMPDERFALIIADPPYLPSDGVGEFPEDPLTAIDGGSDGLDLARECLTVIGRHLIRGGAALLQLRDEAQGRDLAADAAACGLTIDESRQFDGGAVLLLRRTTEGRAHEQHSDER
ncbi:class I SAM-dependent methyltransferase [Aeromicrobium sp. Marseille-Q0843]|uniref:Class I SAM-dependent methyltransferase n=1 Tax=Aeromicrobium phoceense TaxID=2754045 RepID=A0A838XIE8_9ACTN|nr:class I SAM-dependent methyltransferase [Aeromicrobium phoceense]MBA4609647.1 class I SAM-dependent methyltransferase [Aeromicrobium phoceense]